MLHLWESMRGWAVAELRGAEPEKLLDRCRREGLRLGKTERLDGYTLRVRLEQEELPRLRQLAEGCGFALELRSLRGGRAARRRLLRRRWLLLGLVLAGLLLCASRFFIWQIRVLGCERLSQGQVLRALAACGVEPGSFGPGIRQDLVRSRMLTELPELEWMTVNIADSRATVLVRERREAAMTPGQPADILAARSGIIRSMTVLEGHALAGPGDAVLEGDKLVSGRMESLSQGTRLLRASAEIRAETWRELIAVCPRETLRLARRERDGRRFGLALGKNLLQIGKFPRKGLDECGKIVHEYTVGVEGLFALPLRLRVEEQWTGAPIGAVLDRTEEMKRNLLRRLENETDGEVLDYSFSVGRQGELLVVTLRAHCLENIAMTAELP